MSFNIELFKATLFSDEEICIWNIFSGMYFIIIEY